MDLWERRLQALEADYEETIAAGARAEHRRHLEAIVADHRAEYQLVADHETDACGIETPPVITALDESLHPTPDLVPIETQSIEPLSAADIERIKTHMATVELKHEPQWARQISDQQLLELLNRVSRYSSRVCDVL